MKILTIEPNIHKQILKSWEANESVTVIDQNHEAAQAMYDNAMNYSGIPALITWTGGTTGIPKGVVIPWSAVQARCDALASWWKPEDIIKVTSFLPSNHSGGMITSRLSIIKAGGKFVELDKAKNVTCVIGTPKRLREMVLGTLQSNPNMYHNNKDTIRLLVSNGINLDSETRKILEATGAHVCDLYGTSENGGIAFDGVPLSGYTVRSLKDKLEVFSLCNAIDYIGTEQIFPVTEDNFFRTPDSVSFNDKGHIHSIQRR